MTTRRLKTKKLKLRGDDFEIREMKGTERFRCVDIQEREGTTGLAGFLVSRCVIEPKNFKCDDYSGSVVEKLVNEITVLSELGPTAVEAAGKESAGVQSEGTGTG